MPEEVPRLPNRVLPFIWYFVRQFKTQFSVILIVWGLSNVLLAVMPLFFKLFVQAFEAAETTEDIWRLLAPSFITFIILLLVIQPVLAQIGNWLQAKSIPVFVNLTRRQLAVYMHHHSFEYFQSDFAGRLAGRVVETPSAMGDITYNILGPIWYGLVCLVVSTILFATMHWAFGLITLIWAFLFIILLCYYVPKIQKSSKTASENRSVVRGRFVDSISNILTVKLFARAKHEDSYLLEALDKTARGYEAMDLTLFRMWGWLEILTSIFWISVILCLVFTWQTAGMRASDVAMVLPLALQLTQTSWWMSEIFTTFFQKTGEVQEGMKIITAAHDVTDRPDAKPLKAGGSTIEYKDVKFSFDRKTVFDGLNVTIPTGQKVGLVGPSGAGKSTFVQLLLRLFDLQGGEIMIDGQNIAHVTQNSLREHIAVIPQISDLLHRSVTDNIRYGRLDATDEEIVEAAKQANAHEFILELGDKEGNTGYETHVGERGVRLSGGQKQRVAIARAILKNAPLLFLDEATSALDSESERLIQESLFALMEGKTVIAIAHRLSTIAHLDRLLVMENGKIIEDGSHDELLAKNGHYARLWSMQSGGFLAVA